MMIHPRFLPRLRHGFSLIELVVVLILMGILAAIASTSVRGVIVRQRLARAADVVEQFDMALRRAARYRRRPVAGWIDPSRGDLTIKPAGQTATTFTLPRHVTLQSIRFGSSGGAGIRNRIVASRDGTTRSYALRLTIGDADRWVLIVGGTGQVVHRLESDAVNAVLAVR